MIGRLLCLLGLHRYEWRTSRTLDDAGFFVVADECRCRRVGCALAYRWHRVNVERRPW